MKAVVMTKKLVRRSENATFESFKRVPCENWSQSTGDGAVERGDYSPSVTLALKIAKVFEVSVEDIFEYEEELS